MGVLTQHVGHHKGGQLWVGVGIKQPVVWQRVEGVTRFVLHEVQQGGVGVVRGRDGRDLVVFVPCSSASSSSATASALTGVILQEGKEQRLKPADKALTRKVK